ncbi:MAG: hypothetical protein QXG73_00065 [Candidatus Micrarchaeaceae archaeon]
MCDIIDGQSTSNNTATPPPPSAPVQQPSQESVAKKGGTKTALYAAGIIIVIVIIAAVVLLMPKSSSNNSLYNMISSNRIMPVKTFAQAIKAKYNSTNQLNISYSGLATINAESSGTNITMKMPLSIDLMKYNSDERADINVSDIPFLGNLTMDIILDNGEMYTCTKSSLLSSFGLNASSTNSSYQCQPPVSTSGFLNSTTLDALNGSSIHFTSIKQSSYNGHSCVLATGYMNINTANITSTSSISTLGSVVPTSANVNATFSMCLSDTYYVPLTMSLKEVLNSTSASGILSGVSGAVSLQLNETHLSTSVSPSITTLPGPVVKTSAISITSIPTTSIPTTTITTSITPQSGGSFISCANVSVSEPVMDAEASVTCNWVGGSVVVYAGGGNSGYASVKIIGSNNQTYFSNSTDSWCPTQIGSVFLPAQKYTILLGAGRGGGSCSSNPSAVAYLK